MRLSLDRFGGAALVIGTFVVLGLPSHVAQAGAGDERSVAAVAQVDGTAYDDSRTYVDPCAGVSAAVEDDDDGQYVPIAPLRFVSQRMVNVETFDALDGQVRVRDGILEVRWWTRCIDANNVEVADVTDRFWVGVPRDIDLVEPALQAATELVPAPNVSWPTKDPDFGWVYVNTDTEWRIDNLVPVSATAEASNRIASASATVTATPVLTTLLPGEPGAGIGRCTPDQAAGAFYLDIISQCSYTYKNSSAISPTDAFEATIEVSWMVETDVADADPIDDLTTSWSEQLQVGEVQALVIADR